MNLVEVITREVMNELQQVEAHSYLYTHVPVSVSARHLHLSADHLEALFGKGYTLTKHKDISQPGQYACQEKLTVRGPRGSIEQVRVLGPLRKCTQVEVSRSDARKLGVSPPVRSSGDIIGSAAVTLIGPSGSVQLEEGCVIADRHIHMTPSDAVHYGVRNNQKVSVKVEGDKAGVMGEVTIRVHERYALDMHIDTDDANAFGIKGSEALRIITGGEVRNHGNR